MLEHPGTRWSRACGKLLVETSSGDWNIKSDYLGDLLNVSVILTIYMAESMGYFVQRCTSLPGTILKDLNLPLGYMETI